MSQPISAQRFFIISDNRFLAAELILPRRCLPELPFPAALFRVLPEELIPLSEAMAWLMRSLSCSNSATILPISKAEPPGRFLFDILQEQRFAATDNLRSLAKSI